MKRPPWKTLAYSPEDERAIKRESAVVVSGRVQAARGWSVGVRVGGTKRPPMCDTMDM
jgi:hypothetical protein